MEKNGTVELKDIYGIMIYVLSNIYDRQKMRERVDSLLAAKEGVVELKKKHPQRTMAQNRYLHLLLGLFAAETGMTLEDVKQEVFKKICNRDIFCYKKTIGKSGKAMEIEGVRSSAFIDTADMATAITRFRNWSSSEVGIYLPAANEHEALLHAEQVIASYGEYL